MGHVRSHDLYLYLDRESAGEMQATRARLESDSESDDQASREERNFLRGGRAEHENCTHAARSPLLYRAAHAGSVHVVWCVFATGVAEHCLTPDSGWE